MAETRAHALYRAWSSDVGGVCSAARILGISEGHSSRIAKGVRIPSLELAAAIERVTRAWSRGPILAVAWVPVTRPPRPAPPAESEVEAA